MDYIINPSWFYWVSVFAALKILFLAVGCSVAFILGVFCVFAIVDSYDEEEEKEWVKRLKIVVAVSAPLICVGIFIPSESTMIKMMLAKYATVDNVQAIYQAILDGAKYILEGLK